MKGQINSPDVWGNQYVSVDTFTAVVFCLWDLHPQLRLPGDLTSNWAATHLTCDFSPHVSRVKPSASASAASWACSRSSSSRTTRRRKTRRPRRIRSSLLLLLLLLHHLPPLRAAKTERDSFVGTTIILNLLEYFKLALIGRRPVDGSVWGNATGGSPGGRGLIEPSKVFWRESFRLTLTVDV